MLPLTDKAMSEGAWGMSTGLIYVPSSYADTDRSTFVDPHQYGDGLVHLFVNGQPAILYSRATGALFGRAIRKPAPER